MDEFINSQKNVLGISDFLKNSQKYTQENFPDLDIDQLFTNAIQGNLSTNFWTSSLLEFVRTRNKSYDSAHGYGFNCDYHS